MMPSNSPRKLLVIIAVAVALLMGAGLLAFLVSRTSQQVPELDVTITLPRQATVDLFVANEGEEHGTTTTTEQQTPQTTLTQTQTLRLQQGEYRLVVREDADLKSTMQRFTVDDQSTTVTVQLEYKDQKLKELLTAERPAIVTAINQAYPPTQTLYSIEQGWLYKQGDWYATKLIYRGGQANQSDTLRLIAHKQNGTWKVVTDPPTIMISSPQYPTIPQEIVTDINNFK